MVVKKKTVGKNTTTKKKTTVKKATSKKAVAKKTVAKKKVATKVPAKKVVSKKKIATKAPTKKAVSKKKIATKAPAKKATTVTSASTASTKAKTSAPVVTPSAVKKDNELGVKKNTVKSKATQVKPKPVVKQHKPSPIDNIPLIEHSNEQEGDNYMNATQRQHFRDLLNNWKYELMQEVDRTVGYMKDEAANFPDPADRATQEEEFNLELRTRDRERKLIKKIDEALQRIDENDYGFCEACGVEIGTKRLEARPTATLCIDCKTVDEIREKQLLA